MKITGLTLTDLAGTIAREAKQAGTGVIEDARSETFFRLSDNASLADKGVPAVTVAGAFEYPNLHQTSDEWPTLDYNLFASFANVISRATLAIAASPTVPQWREDNRATSRYVKAWRELHSSGGHE